MYRTGDIASWNERGHLRYHGRRDGQVQVGGIRVELGEVESILATAPGVRLAAVGTVNESAGHADALVGYVVFEEGAAPSATDLREHLGSYLPDGVVPSRFVPLDEMPRTSSGKIDRTALPKSGELIRTKERVAPRNETEERVARIWCEHLGLDDVGVHDNFFEVGGHSLLAVRIQHDVSDEFDVDVPLGTIFENPTISELASKIAVLTADDVEMDDVLALLSEIEDL
jgi:surfactin family lipopeptide synthetase A/lichenysin synthetase A